MSFNPTYRLQNLRVTNQTVVQDLTILGTLNIPLATGSNVGTVQLSFANDGVSPVPVLFDVQVSSVISTGAVSFYSNPTTIIISNLNPEFVFPVSVQCFGASFETTPSGGNPVVNHWNYLQQINTSNLKMQYYPASSATLQNSLVISGAELANLAVENANLTTFATPGNAIQTAVIVFNF